MESPENEKKLRIKQVFNLSGIIEWCSHCEKKMKYLNLDLETGFRYMQAPF